MLSFSSCWNNSRHSEGDEMIDEIVNQLKQEDYEDASGEVSTPPVVDTPTDEEPQLDIDTILDKINKSGMDSLTKAEKDFLYNL